MLTEDLCASCGHSKASHTPACRADCDRMSCMCSEFTPGATTDLTKLQAHAELTIKKIEMFFKRRGWTTGKKKWEQELLISAYEALGRPAPKLRSKYDV